jgi:hypothetical protein
MDSKLSGRKRKIKLSQLEEWREKAYHSAKIYKYRTKRWHDKRIRPKEFKAGDKVLLFNSRVKLFGHGKLRSKWIGPYTVINKSPHGAITIQDDEGKISKVNCHCLKVFLTPSDLNEVVDFINLVDFDNIHLLDQHESPYVWNSIKSALPGFQTGRVFASSVSLSQIK